ncbi:MAG: lipoprotein-releasing ABC transporter permease subunit [Sphingomonadales bacterium]
MFSSFEWGVAFRYLKARRNDRFISVIAGFSLIGICLGVMVLIVVMAVMNGFRHELLDRVLGLNGHAVIVGYNGELLDYDALTEEVRAVPGVIRANPMVEGQVMATYQGRASGSVLRGVSPEMLATHPFVAPNIIEGSLERFGETGVIALGVQLAQTLGIQIGDPLTLISPKGTATPFGTAPRVAAYEVIALFEVGVYDYDNAFVFMPLEGAQVYFKMYDAVSGIEVFVEDPDDLDETSAALAAISEGRGFVNDWRQMNQSLFTALVVERNVMFIILTLIIFVAAFNIISSLIILVKDKARDVAIMRTMGASRKSLMKIFMISGATIGLVGTILGLIFGLLIVAYIHPIQAFIQSFSDVNLWSPEVRFLTELPAEIKISEVALIVVVSFLLAFLATLPPSWRAANLDPVDVLRNEG